MKYKSILVAFHADGMDKLDDSINNAVEKGWEFVSMSTVVGHYGVHYFVVLMSKKKV